MKLAQANSLKYLNISYVDVNVMKHLLASCTQLEILFCKIADINIDDLSQCIRQNSESLKSLQIIMLQLRTFNEAKVKLATAISNCLQLEEVSIEMPGMSVQTWKKRSKPLKFFPNTQNMKKKNLSNIFTLHT